MTSLRAQREVPFAWVTWASKILAGESTCIWSAWVRAHFITAKAPSDFAMGTWQLDHSALVRKAVVEHEQNGYTVYSESQNLFSIRGKSGTLAGKPDVVAVREKVGWIVDAKTGNPKASDKIQIQIYMWAMSKANPDFADVMFDGKVIYKCGYSIVTAEEVDSLFIKRLGELMKEVCGETEPHKAPSYGECRFCPVASDDCGDRVEAKSAYEGKTEEF